MSSLEEVLFIGLHKRHSAPSHNFNILHLRPLQLFIPPLNFLGGQEAVADTSSKRIQGLGENGCDNKIQFKKTLT
jgi:hypothetical protein